MLSLFSLLWAVVPMFSFESFGVLSPSVCFVPPLSLGPGQRSTGMPVLQVSGMLSRITSMHTQHGGEPGISLTTYEVVSSISVINLLISSSSVYLFSPLEIN